MRQLKEPRSYEKQIERLRDEHDLVIIDENEAMYILTHVNYYRLSAYGIGLKRPDDKEKYIEGISIENLYRLYCFDSKLRNILIPAIEEIEIELRTKIAYRLAMTYGAEGYRNSSNFQQKTNKEGETVFTKTMNKLDDEIKHQNMLPCVIHHNKEYGGHFPVWVAIELFSFGMLSSLYSIMKPADQAAVAKEFLVDAYHLKSWILSLVEIRNICAHYNRIYNMPLKQTATLYREYESYQCNRLFPVLLLIKRLMRDSDLWKETLVQLERLIEQYGEVNLDFIGFPQEWKDVLQKPSAYSGT